MNYLNRTHSNVSYPLEWVPLEGGDEVQVYGEEESSRNPRYVRAFSTDHSRNEVSLGYNIIEVRQRLKEEYRETPQEEIKEIAEGEGREKLMENYGQKIFTYGGDSVPLDPEKISGTEVLCHDCTFLDEEDRKMFKHATLGEAVDVAMEAGVGKKMLGLHVSSRYKNDLAKYRKKVLEEKDPPFELELIRPGQIYREY